MCWILPFGQCDIIVIGGCSFRILLKCLRFRGDNNRHIRCRVTRPRFFFLRRFCKIRFGPTNDDDDDDDDLYPSAIRPVSSWRSSRYKRHTKMTIIIIHILYRCSYPPAKTGAFIVSVHIYIYIMCTMASPRVRARFMCKSPTNRFKPVYDNNESKNNYEFRKTTITIFL